MLCQLVSAYGSRLLQLPLLLVESISERTLPSRPKQAKKKIKTGSESWCVEGKEPLEGEDNPFVEVLSYIYIYVNPDL